MEKIFGNIEWPATDILIVTKIIHSERIEPPGGSAVDVLLDFFSFTTWNEFDNKWNDNYSS